MIINAPTWHMPNKIHSIWCHHEFKCHSYKCNYGTLNHPNPYFTVVGLRWLLYWPKHTQIFFFKYMNKIILHRHSVHVICGAVSSFFLVQLYIS